MPGRRGSVRPERGLNRLGRLLPVLSLVSCLYLGLGAASTALGRLLGRLLYGRLDRRRRLCRPTKHVGAWLRSLRRGQGKGRGRRRRGNRASLRRCPLYASLGLWGRQRCLPRLIELADHHIGGLDLDHLGNRANLLFGNVTRRLEPERIWLRERDARDHPIGVEPGTGEFCHVRPPIGERAGGDAQ